jgi:hypothetical protein
MWSPNVVVNSMDIFQSIIGNSIRVDAVSGSVSLVRPLGRDLPSGFGNWQFNIAANDEAGSPTSLIGYGYFNLVLLDINDHSPVFDTCCLNGSVAEGAPAGELI